MGELETGLPAWADTVGVVIGKNAVLVQEGSNVFKGALITNKDKFVVTPGRQGEDAPFGDFKIKNTEWDATGNSNNYHVLILDKNEDGKDIGDLVPPINLKPTESTIDFMGDNLQFIGYAKRIDVDQSAPIEYKNMIQKTSQGTQINKDEYEPDLLFLSTDVGTNGRGPVLDENKDLVAMISGYGNSIYAARLTTIAYDWITQVVTDNQ